MGIEAAEFFGTLVVFLIFVWDVIIISEIIQSSTSIVNKLMWSALIFIFPILGIIIYYIFERRQHQFHQYQYQTVP